MEIAGFTVGQLSTGSLALLVLVSLIRGWLVPRKVMEERVADRDQENARLREENAVWRRAAQESAATASEARAQQQELLTLARTTNQVLAAFPRPREETARVADAT